MINIPAYYWQKSVKFLQKHFGWKWTCHCTRWCCNNSFGKKEVLTFLVTILIQCFIREQLSLIVWSAGDARLNHFPVNVSAQRRLPVLLLFENISPSKSVLPSVESRKYHKSEISKDLKTKFFQVNLVILIIQMNEGSRHARKILKQ